MLSLALWIYGTGETTGTPAFAGTGTVLFVPFDNDCWVKYDVRPLAGEQLSYEVSALFQPRSRRGLIVGSVEHDAWKTGVRSQTRSGRKCKRSGMFRWSYECIDPGYLATW